MTLRFVLDTNQIVAAGTAWLERGLPASDPNRCRRILIAVAESHTGLYCEMIMGEYIEKLLDRNNPQERVQKMMTYLMGAFTQVPIATKNSPYPPSDPDDEVFVICALDGQADYLVSDDHHLLALKLQYSEFTIGNSAEVAATLKC
jgi:predicted nucleic acid-binding protein